MLFLCDMILETQQCMKVLNCNHPLAAPLGTAPHGRTPSNCSARSRSARKPLESASFGRAPWPCHDYPTEDSRRWTQPETGKKA